MKKLVKLAMVIAIIISFNVTAEVDADAAKALAKENGCFRCHGIDKDKDGPSFQKSATKFKAFPDGEAKLLNHLSSGEPAKFPDGTILPHAILKSDADASKNLVDWILSL